MFVHVWNHAIRFLPFNFHHVNGVMVFTKSVIKSLTCYRKRRVAQGTKPSPRTAEPSPEPGSPTTNLRSPALESWWPLFAATKNGHQQRGSHQEIQKSIDEIKHVQKWPFGENPGLFWCGQVGGYFRAAEP